MKNYYLRVRCEHRHQVSVVDAAVLSLSFGAHEQHPLGDFLEARQR
ncbi:MULTISPECIES: hypothetical protein [unclassified Pseudarthrobacter]